MPADVVVVRDLAVLQQASDSYARLDRPLLLAMLLGKRVATPLYCASASPGARVPIQFIPLLRKKFGVFFTAGFRAKHDSTLVMFRRAERTLGDKCCVKELETADNARALGRGGMVTDGLEDFSTFVRQHVSVARERSERGTYRKG